MTVLSLIILLSTNLLVSAELNNACSDWQYYDSRNIPLLPAYKNCWYNPDVSGELVDVAQRNNYVATPYVITTTDGYTLKHFRLGNPTGKTIVVIHGIYQNPIGWTLQGKNSFAFVLADAGFDVWLISLRGTRYATHSTLQESDPEYYQYTPHEMGIKDIKESIDYIITIKPNEKLILICYSMGATASLIYSSTYPEHAFENIELLSLLAPVAYLDDISSILGYGIPLWPVTSKAFKAANTYQILKPTAASKLLASTTFLPTLLNVKDYQVSMGSLFGISNQLNPATLAATVLNGGDAISIYVIDFYAQIGNSHVFQALNYGTDALNLKHYDTIFPPKYDLSKIKVKISLHYALNDALATQFNVEKLFSLLNPEITCKHLVSYEKFSHQDFAIAINAKEMVYDLVVDECHNGDCINQ